MGNTTVGKLKEILVLETELDGVETVMVYPRGTIVEVSSEEDYPSSSTDKDFDDAAKYLKSLDDDEEKDCKCDDKQSIFHHDRHIGTYCTKCETFYN